jgi:hypothetical protein
MDILGMNTTLIRHFRKPLSSSPKQPRKWCHSPANVLKPDFKDHPTSVPKVAGLRAFMNGPFSERKLK